MSREDKFLQKEPRLNKSIARHHKSLVEVLNHAGNQNAEPIYSRKGKERAIELDANSDKYSADEYTIRVSRPFKRKEKGRDLDDTDYIGSGSQPKKKATISRRNGYEWRVFFFIQAF